MSKDSSTTPERLIEVAGSIFAEKGATATVREICGAAGCSVAAINYHFGDKEQLYRRCVEMAFRTKLRLFPTPGLLDLGNDPFESLVIYVTSLTKRICGEGEWPWQSQLMLRVVINPNDIGAEVFAGSFRSDYHLLETLIGKLLRNTYDSPKTRQSLALQIVARCMFLRTGQHLRELLGIDSQLWRAPEQYAREVCDSIRMQIAGQSANGMQGHSHHSKVEVD
ncbi:MAG: TetR/AcrR family transcriptional regulator [Planctomycetales bacterium]|nr:TetR/AcrR family transcriptional regulator [Planctomycetales bacterium]